MLSNCFITRTAVTIIFIQPPVLKSDLKVEKIQNDEKNVAQEKCFVKACQGWS